MRATRVMTRMDGRPMRRLLAVLGATVLVASAVGSTSAATSPKVTGGFGYNAVDDPSEPRSVTIDAQGTGTAARGTFTWKRPSGIYSGTISCLVVEGSAAWFAGPVTSSPPRTSEGFPAVFGFVYDGATPGNAGDYAFIWGADPGQTLSDMEALCADMDTNFFGLWPFAVTGGDIKVR